jgi:decaprenylphospho-beta-D-erythro-pentofuranosid-2-ulose 2-reductase
VSDIERVAIFGATSDIAAAAARLYAAGSAELVLVGRDRAALDAQAADLAVRGAAATHVLTADFAAVSSLANVVATAWETVDGLDVALVAYGSLPDQAAAQADAAVAEAALVLNFVSPVVLCDRLAERFEAQGAGTLVAISSVAGDRGRQSNYLYGAAKGGLQRALEGLRHRLFKAGVAVVDVRPGFVATKMTDRLDRGGFLWATPEKVAADIVRAAARRRAVLYTPWFWAWLLRIVRGLPRPLFHRSKL